MIKTNIVGQFFGSNGYCSHIRQLANALSDEGVFVRVDTPKFPGWETQVNDQEYLMLNRPFESDMVSILVGQPHFLPLLWSENPRSTICFVIWEGDRIPKFWVDFLSDKRTGQVWVPSQHVKSAVLRTEPKLESKIRIVPHGVNNKLFKKQVSVSGVFTFVANKGWSQGLNDRGGIQYLLKAFCEEFKPDEKVQLRIKINSSYNGVGWNLNDELKKLNLKEPHAPVFINADFIGFNDLPKAYDGGDVFVNPTRAEAFGLTGLEAHSCGLPTISTGFGGQTDYMSESTDWFLNYTLEEVKHDILYEGVVWAVPDVKHLRELLRYCFNNPDECRQKGLKAELCVVDWLWSVSAKKAVKFLKELV